MKKSAKDSELEALASNLDGLAGPGTIVFRTTGLPEEKVLLWDGLRIEDFLKVFHQSGNKVLYLRQETIVEDDEAPGHVGEIYQLDVAFLDQGYFHNFRRMADWFEEMVTENEPLFNVEEPDHQTVLAELDQLIGDMLKETPAKKWTKGAVHDFCLEREIPIYMADLAYNRIKRRLLKGAGDGAEHVEGEGQTPPGGGGGLKSG